MMDISDIVAFWKKQDRPIKGRWVHPDDAAFFIDRPHSFNLDFPAGPYVGDILRAPVIILGANAGYSSETSYEFTWPYAIPRYLARTASPSDCDWTGTGRPYYDKRNYGKLLFDGRVGY